jgi:hypothetical protein
MNGLLRSELLKQRTTRTILQLPLWMVGLVALIVVLPVVGFSVHDLSVRANQLKIYGWGTGIGSLFAALLGALSITGEIRHGTIRPTYLTTPQRARVIAAKAAASALGGLALGLLAEALPPGSVAQASRPAESTSRSAPATSRNCSPAVSPQPRYGRRSESASARSSATKSAPSSASACGC